MYVSLRQAQDDMRSLLNFIYARDWRLGQEVEQIAYPVLQGDFILHSQGGTLGDTYDTGIPNYNVSTSLPDLPTSVDNPYSTTTPSFLDVLNQIGAAISGGVHTYAMTATDLLKAQMQVAAMQAQAKAGFIASPTYIPNANASPPIPSWMLLAGLGLIAVVLLKGN